MSNAEIASQSSPEFTFTFPVMVAGVIANVAQIPNFLGATSQIVGCVRVTSGGVVGQPSAGLSVSATAPGFAIVTLVSSVNTDTSVYRIYWTNQVAQSQLVTVLSC